MSNIKDVIIPNGWEKILLKEVVKAGKPITYGIVQPGEDISPLGIPLIRGKDYSSGTVSLSGLYHVSKEVNNPYKRSQVLKNDILFSIVGYVGYTAIVPFQLEGANITQTTARISVNNVNNYKYLYYCLQSSFIKKEVKKYVKGSAQPGLNLADVEKFKLILPNSLQEQQKIAEILSTVDEAIEKTDALIEKYKKIKTGLMEDLFTKGIDINTGKPHTKFKDSKLGKIPESWEVDSIGNKLINFRLGGNYKNSEEQTDSVLIKMGNINRGAISIDKISYINIGEDIFQIDKIKYGDLFFNTRNTLELVGKVSIWKDEIQNAYYNSNLMSMNYDNNFFMNYKFNSYEGIKKLRNLATGTTSVAAIYTKDLIKIKFVFPKINEQEKIAEIFTEADNKIEKEEAYKEKLEKIKKGLMSDLLTGKVRVKY